MAFTNRCTAFSQATGQSECNGGEYCSWYVWETYRDLYWKLASKLPVCWIGISTAIAVLQANITGAVRNPGTAAIAQAASAEQLELLGKSSI